MVQPTMQFTEGDHDVLPVSSPFLKSSIPSLHLRYRWQIYFQFKVAVERSTSGNIRQTEYVAAEKSPARKNLIEQLKMSGAPSDFVANGRPVPLRLRRAVVSPEDTNQEIGLERRLRPIHPAVDLGSLARILQPESARTVAGSQISKDRMRLPNDCAVIIGDRNTTMWIHCHKFRGIKATKLTADFKMPMLQS